MSSSGPISSSSSYRTSLGLQQRRQIHQPQRPAAQAADVDRFSQTPSPSPIQRQAIARYQRLAQQIKEAWANYHNTTDIQLQLRFMRSLKGLYLDQRQEFLRSISSSPLCELERLEKLKSDEAELVNTIIKALEDTKTFQDKTARLARRMSFSRTPSPAISPSSPKASFRIRRSLLSPSLATPPQLASVPPEINSLAIRSSPFRIPSPVASPPSPKGPPREPLLRARSTSPKLNHIHTLDPKILANLARTSGRAEEQNEILNAISALRFDDDKIRALKKLIRNPSLSNDFQHEVKIRQIISTLASDQEQIDLLADLAQHRSLSVQQQKNFLKFLPTLENVIHRNKILTHLAENPSLDPDCQSEIIERWIPKIGDMSHYKIASVAHLIKNPALTSKSKQAILKIIEAFPQGMLTEELRDYIR